MRTIAEINEKIVSGKVTVWTIEELKKKVKQLGIKKTSQKVDVIWF